MNTRHRWTPRFQGDDAPLGADFIGPIEGQLHVVNSPNQLHLRASASSSGTHILYMPNGATVDYVDDDGRDQGWAHVTYQGKTGYASLDYLAQGASSGTTPAPSGGGGSTANLPGTLMPVVLPGQQGKVTATSLVMRSAPSTSASNVLGKGMPQGSIVTVTGDIQNGFYPITFEGKGGWGWSGYIASIPASPNVIPPSPMPGPIPPKPTPKPAPKKADSGLGVIPWIGAGILAAAGATAIVKRKKHGGKK